MGATPTTGFMFELLKTVLFGDSEPAHHRKYQRKSRRCVSCGDRILSVAAHDTRRCVIADRAHSVTFSGGKISCRECDVDHSNYCVHGVLLREDCYYCPETERINSLGELDSK